MYDLDYSRCHLQSDAMGDCPLKQSMVALDIPTMSNRAFHKMLKNLGVVKDNLLKNCK